MNEDDYLVATNLAKLRIVVYVLNDVLFLDVLKEDIRRDALAKVATLCIDLEQQLNSWRRR